MGEVGITIEGTNRGAGGPDLLRTPLPLEPSPESWPPPDLLALQDFLYRGLPPAAPTIPGIGSPGGHRIAPRGGQRLDVLIPALNEEDGIAKVLKSLPRGELAAAGVDTVPIVVDGHSTDATRELARAMGARVFIQGQSGKGSALREIIPHLVSDYAVMIDADGSYPTDAIPEVVRLLRGGFDVVTGSRLAGRIENGAMSGLHRIGNRMLTILANYLYPSGRTTDLCTGLWGFRVDALKKLHLTAEGFDFEADLYTEAVLHRLRTREIPIRYTPREGSAKISWEDGVRIAWLMLSKRLQRIGTRNGKNGVPRERRRAAG